LLFFLSHNLSLTTDHDAQSPSSRHIRRPARRQIEKSHATFLSSRVIAPWAIGREPHQEIVEQDFRSEFHREPRQTIRSGAPANVASQANEYVRVVDQSVQPHGASMERSKNI
jgi:hypothetical protein